MQKIAYLSNSRDYKNQVDINKNQYITYVNELLQEGWTVVCIKGVAVTTNDEREPAYKETFPAYVVLEKPDEQDE